MSRLTMIAKRVATRRGTERVVHFYFIDGVRVSRREFKAGRISPGRRRQVAIKKPSRTKRAWPMLSEALAVHPDQIPEAIAHAKARGVPTDFTPDGRVIHPDRAHRKAYHAATGYFDKDAGYGDASRGSYRG